VRNSDKDHGDGRPGKETAFIDPHWNAGFLSMISIVPEIRDFDSMESAPYERFQTPDPKSMRLNGAGPQIAPQEPEFGPTVCNFWVQGNFDLGMDKLFKVVGFIPSKFSNAINECSGVLPFPSQIVVLVHFNTTSAYRSTVLLKLS